MLHEARERHAVGVRELGHRPVAAGEGRKYSPARRIGKRREHCVEMAIRILNHKVQYLPGGWRLSSPGEKGVNRE